MSKLPPIVPYEQRMAESTEISFNGMPPSARYFMQREIDELRQRVAVLQSMIPKPLMHYECEDPECGNGYGCICYTR